MTSGEFRAALARLGLTQVGFAQLLHGHGDTAEIDSVIRRVQRWASGDHKIPGETIALLNLLLERRRKLR